MPASERATSAPTVGSPSSRSAPEPHRTRARRNIPAIRTASISAAIAALLSTALVGCSSTDDAEVGVHTAPPTVVASAASAATSTPETAPGTTTPQSSAQDNQPANAQSQLDESYRNFSICMRDNGYPDFEDFSADVFRGATSQEEGATIFTDEMLRRGVDLSDPASGPAMEACQEYLNQAAAGAPELSGADDQRKQELMLTFAKCMRTQGVDDWPDPDFQTEPATGYSLETIQSLNFQDPKIIAAGQSCDPNGEVLAIFGR